MKNIGKIVLLIFCIAIAMPNIFALSSCITMSTGGTSEIATQNNVPNYVSLRVYNTSAEGSICEDGVYQVKAEFVSLNGQPDPLGVKQLSTYMDYSFNENNFQLLNGENKRVLLTLTPKGGGIYVIKITAMKAPLETTTGASIVSTTSALIKVVVQGGAVIEPVQETTATQEVPFWTTHKNCPDGTVIENSQTCPVSNDNVFAQTPTTTKDKNASLSPVTPLTGLQSDSSNLPILPIAGVAIVGVAAAIIFVPKRKREASQEEYPETPIQSQPAPKIEQKPLIVKEMRQRSTVAKNLPENMGAESPAFEEVLWEM